VIKTSPAARAALRRIVLAGWLAYWGALTYLLLAPKVPRVPITISPKGLVVHFCTFAILAYFSVFTRRLSGAACTRTWALAWSAVYAAYGGLTELLQPLTRRHADFEDFLADAAGAAIILVLAALRDARHTQVALRGSPGKDPAAHHGA
jgi:hypothetical protein